MLNKINPINPITTIEPQTTCITSVPRQLCYVSKPNQPCAYGDINVMQYQLGSRGFGSRGFGSRGNELQLCKRIRPPTDPITQMYLSPYEDTAVPFFECPPTTNYS